MLILIKMQLGLAKSCNQRGKLFGLFKTYKESKYTGGCLKVKLAVILINAFLARLLSFQRSKNPRFGSIPDTLLAAEQQQTLSSAPAAKSY